MRVCGILCNTNVRVPRAKTMRQASDDYDDDDHWRGHTEGSQHATGFRFARAILARIGMSPWPLMCSLGTIILSLTDQLLSASRAH